MTCNIAATVTTPTPNVTASVGSVAIAATISNPTPVVTAVVGGGDTAATVANPTPVVTAAVGSVAVAATIENPTPVVTATVTVGGAELNAEDRAKLDSIEWGSQRNRSVVHELWAMRALSDAADITIPSATYVDIAHGVIDRGTWNAGGKIELDCMGTWVGTAPGAKLQFRVAHNGVQITNEIMQAGLKTATIFRFEFEWIMGRLEGSGTIGGVQRQQWKATKTFIDDQAEEHWVATSSGGAVNHQLDDFSAGQMVSEVSLGQTDIDFVSITDQSAHEISLEISVASDPGAGTARISGSTAYQFGYREVLWGPILDERIVP